jgi:hypothetical protein
MRKIIDVNDVAKEGKYNALNEGWFPKMSLSNVVGPHRRRAGHETAPRSP